MKYLSQLMTTASGSLGGVTASHNRGGQYFRARTIPTDPSSAQQTAVRNAVAQLATAWSSELTATERSAWDVYASNVTMTDALGESRHLSGQQHYIRSNVPRLQAELDRQDDAPTTFDLGSFGLVITAASEAASLSVAFDADDAWVDETGSALLVYASRPQNPGVLFFKGPYRLAGKVEGDATTPPTSPAMMLAPFALTDDQAVMLQYRVTRADGRLSSAVRERVIVA